MVDLAEILDVIGIRMTINGPEVAAYSLLQLPVWDHLALR
jgi:hypothetical protein